MNENDSLFQYVAKNIVHLACFGPRHQHISVFIQFNNIIASLSMHI
jgi:hypothetical protein